jgi:CBS domain-containing protein
MPSRTVRTIVTGQQVVTATPELTVEKAARLMQEKGIGALPVIERGRLVGIFTERDGLFRVLAEGLPAGKTTLAEVMTRDPHTIHPDKPVRNALMMMHEGGYRHVPVVERGQLLGMVSARDALDPELDEFGTEMLNREHISQIL